MNMSLFQISAAVFMLGAAIALIVMFRKYRAAASERRMLGMLECVGLDPVIAASGDNEAIMKEVRQRCKTCAAEGICERWLAGNIESGNFFCPNAKVFEALKRAGGTVG